VNQRVVRPPETLYEGTSDMERTTTSQAAEIAEPRHADNDEAERFSARPGNVWVNTS
jgi:hypothetical protein